MLCIQRFSISRTAAIASIALGCSAIAQPAVTTAADPVARPEAEVPSISYRSVFKQTSLGIEKDTVDWRKANDDVGRFVRGHVDILKLEEAESAQPMTKPVPSAAPKPPVPAQSLPAAPSMQDTSKSTPPTPAKPAHQH